MKRLKFYIFLVSVTLLAACSSTKSVVNDPTIVVPDNALTFKKKVMENRQQKNEVTAHMSVEIKSGEKSISCGGNLRMSRGEVIQLNLTFLGFAVGTMEFTPSDVLILDRVNKNFVRAKYDDVSFLKTAQVDFYMLQSLFWNELFVPGEKSAEGQLGRFKTSESGQSCLLMLNDAPRLDYGFLTDKTTGLINRVTVEGKNVNDDGKLTWKYSEFSNLDGKKFPTMMDVTFAMKNRAATLSLELTKLNNKSDWEKHTSVSGKYTQKDANSLLNSLMNM